MTSRQSLLKRIETVYGLVEEMHSVALHQAAALVDEAERAIGEERLQMRMASHAARTALMTGDREQRMIFEVQLALNGRRGSQLEVLRLERQGETDVARQKYHASRIRSEQMKTVVQQSRATEELIAGRRLQAATDDRFLSRLRWRLRQTERR